MVTGLSDQAEQELWSKFMSVAASWRAVNKFQGVHAPELSQLVDYLLPIVAAEIKAAELRVIETVATDEGWEQSRDHLARKFGFPDKYSHAPGDCTCATLTGEQQ